VRRGLLLAAGLFGCACGARTGFYEDDVSGAGGDDDSGASVDAGPDAPGVPFEAAPSCANADRPWLLFELEGPQTPLSVYAMRIDGTDGHTVPLAHSSSLYASLSRDETKLFYVSYEDADGGNEGVLYRQDFAAGTTTRILQGNSPTYSTLSADGSTIVYTLGYDVHAVNADGSNDRPLLVQPQDVPWGYGHPVFLGASNTVLYGLGGAFGSIRADGSGDQTLIAEGTNGFDYPNPAASPDLTSLVAAVMCPDDSQTWLRLYPFASLPGSCDSGTQLVATQGFSSSPNSAADPAWGPTGLIAFADAKDIYVVDPAGGPARSVTTALTGTSGEAFDPIWASGCAAIP
jgi:hypothetical protein